MPWAGAFFALDAGRDTGRVLLSLPEKGQLILDFASFRGADLQSDLRQRDFTINAIALDLNNPETLIDPLHGATTCGQVFCDLAPRRPCRDDPLRILRCIRQAVEFELRDLRRTA